MNKYVFLFVTAMVFLYGCSEEDPNPTKELLPIEVDTDLILVSSAGSAIQVIVKTPGWSLLKAGDIIGTDTVEFINNPSSSGVYKDTLQTNYARFFKYENYIWGGMKINQGKERSSFIEIGGPGLMPRRITLHQERSPFEGEEMPHPPGSLF